MLLPALAAVLALLWMLDAFFTIQVLRKKGDDKETNSLLRGLYGRSALLFVATKIAIMAFVLSALLLLSLSFPITAESVMFIFIYIYAKVDWHNYRIWKKRNNKTEDTKSARSKRI